MKIEAGGRYIARNGDIITITECGDGKHYPCKGYINDEKDTVVRWGSDGSVYGFACHDIVKEEEMKIEVGKKYKTRGGDVAEIIEFNSNKRHKPFAGHVNGNLEIWTVLGGYQRFGLLHDFDLVSEHVEPCSATSHQIGGDHYSSKDIQPIDYIHANDLGFCEGNVIKYVTRHKDKNGKQDIEKAIHYLQLILQQQYS